MTVADRLELRERTHLEIASSAAVAAGLATNEAEARRNIESILAEHGVALKSAWLRERGGGIKGWRYFLRTFGYEETLVIRPKLSDAIATRPDRSFSMDGHVAGRQ